MICAWRELLGILPGWLSEDVDRLGRDKLQEIRLRLGQVPELKLGSKSLWLDRLVTGDDLNFVVNTASRYSPWAAQTVSQGFLTAPGGHRIGLCGESVIKSESFEGIRKVLSLCIRVARDFPGIGTGIVHRCGSVLIIGPPGSGKTTLLRDVAREISRKETLAVVDERGELFPVGISRGKRMDVLSGCSKIEGIEMLLRTMGPEWIAVDEVTSEQDCQALIRAGWCGIRLLATAHAGSVEDLNNRPVYRALAACKLFEHILVLNRDKSWQEERVAI